MPRIARQHEQHRFDLYPSEPKEQRLHERLKALAQKGQQREWIVTALLKQLEEECSQSPPKA